MSGYGDSALMESARCWSVELTEFWLLVHSAMRHYSSSSPLRYVVQAPNALLNISMLLGTATSGFSLPSISRDTYPA